MFRIRSVLPLVILPAAAACATTPIPPAQTHAEHAAASMTAAPPRGHVVKPGEIDAHVRFLASDLLEGRAPATRGGRLAAEYIASQLRLFGVEPGVNGSYFQEFPIEVVGADRSKLSVVAGGRASARLRYPEDIVVWAGSAAPRSEASGELIFVGYGTTAPEFRWDDFKDVDVRGKILLVLVNDPPETAAEPNLFGGRAMTYYGRWTYKFEEAERRGAAGMLIVHTTERAGYPWHTVVGSWAKEQRMLPRPATGPAPIGVRGWITDSAATALLSQAGIDLAQLQRAAESRDFRPVPTGINVAMSFPNTVERLQAVNVVGVVRGTDPVKRDEYVAYSAHFDHLGIGPPVNGDSIYNGAFDNASGVAVILGVAHSAAHSPRPARSQLFVFVDAEESGLLGSEYFAAHPTVPIDRIIANLNVDGGNLLGRVRTLRVLGDTKSSLGPMLAELVRGDTLTIAPDTHPERGYFYRSDHFSFAKVGVPSASIAAGVEFVGRPAGWGIAQEEEYTSRRYHQPSDEYRPDFDLTGAAQLAGVVYRFGSWLANSPVVPTWNADAEFRALRPGGE
ncbi:MAG: M28 family peptidase [Gemmatimonadaceae bacterium]|nr:M28 family peptidase [Gemmatimonadaceae bacterium]